MNISLTVFHGSTSFLLNYSFVNFSHNAEVKKEIASVLTYLKDPDENPEKEDLYEKVKRQAARSIPGPDLFKMVYYFSLQLFSLNINVFN